MILNIIILTPDEEVSNTARNVDDSCKHRKDFFKSAPVVLRCPCSAKISTSRYTDVQIRTSFFLTSDSLHQGCQMVCFQTKIPILGKFWRVLKWKILVYFMTIWSILLLLEIFYVHLVYFVVIWYNFSRFGILYEEESGNPGLHTYVALFCVE
jgi:hypothetical protein